MRGKAAAKSANRRAGDAQERCQQLESELRIERLQHKADINELKEQISRLVSEREQHALALSHTRVQTVIQECSEQIATLQHDHVVRSVAALNILLKGATLPTPLMISVAETLGVSDQFKILRNDDVIPNRSEQRADRFRKRAVHARLRDEYGGKNDGTVSAYARSSDETAS